MARKTPKGRINLYLFLLRGEFFGKLLLRRGLDLFRPKGEAKIFFPAPIKEGPIWYTYSYTLRKLVVRKEGL